MRDASVEWIWFDSPGFNRFRGDAWMKEPCRSCPEKTKDFGGCRCQAYLLTGDAANADPVCDLSPHHHLVTEAVARAGRPRVEEKPLIFRDHRKSTAPSHERPALAIRAERLIKRYGETLAVDGVDLAIPRGQFFGLLGPNGAGKTSTIHMLSTLIRPTSGEAWVAGYSVPSRSSPYGAASASCSRIRRSIARFRSPRICASPAAQRSCRVREIRRRSTDLLELFGLSEKRDLPVASLSGGMRRALDIARGVIHQPQILFLDEPTIGLDLPNRRAIWRHIARLRIELGITVFLTTHYLEEAIDCDEVAFLSARPHRAQRASADTRSSSSADTSSKSKPISRRNSPSGSPRGSARRSSKVIACISAATRAG